MEDALEDLELSFECNMQICTIERLIDVGKGMGVQDLDKNMKKTRVMKLFRDHVLKTAEDTPEEKHEFLLQLQDAFKLSVDETTVAHSVTESESKGATADLATLLQNLTMAADPADAKASIFRRQLKIIGIIAADPKDKGINYLNLVSQIADAKALNYSEDEIARAVRKAISTSSFLRTYFDTKSEIKLNQMMDMIRDFYQEKPAAEQFADLGKLCQLPQEKATEFLLRGFELSQKVLAAASAEGEMYETRLVHGTFCRAMRTGLSSGLSKRV